MNTLDSVDNYKRRFGAVFTKTAVAAGHGRVLRISIPADGTLGGGWVNRVPAGRLGLVRLGLLVFVITLVAALRGSSGNGRRHRWRVSRQEPGSNRPLYMPGGPTASLATRLRAAT